MVKEFEYNNYDPNEVVESQDGDDSQSRGSGEKKRKRKFYPSNVQGRYIVNAVTGEKYPGHLVGRFHEDLYFSVMLCSGENGPNPVTLFFESPTQYMKHFHRTVSFKNREDWLNKRDAYVKRG